MYWFYNWLCMNYPPYPGDPLPPCPPAVKFDTVGGLTLRPLRQRQVMLLPIRTSSTVAPWGLRGIALLLEAGVTWNPITQ